MAGPRVVIVGAGIVGASLADELTERGWDRVTVVDAGPLPTPGGSTSHAPGVVFQTNGTKVMSDFARYSVAKFSALQWQGSSCYLPVGGLEIATTPERAAELHRRYGWAQSWGIPGALLLDAGEAAARWDLLDPGAVLGGLFVPDDGIAKAVWAVQAQLARATERGATVLDRHEVLGFRTADTGSGTRISGVEVRTPDGTAVLDADVVVCCAGIWGQRVAGFVGQTLALTPLAHQFAWTAPVRPLAGRRTESVRPVLRHQDADLYYRENHDRLGIGSYRHRPMPVEVQELEHWSRFGEDRPGQPSVLPFTPADFEFPLAETARLMPALGEVTLAQPFNGVFSFTTDNLPLLGPHAAVDGFWTAEAVWVTHSAGVARAMAEWIVDGYTGFDVHACDVNRFERHQLAPDYIVAKDCQNFVEVYDILHPLDPMEHSRPLRVSPFHQRQVELGAVFLEANGWERPQWYAANEALLTSDRNTGWHVPAPDKWAARHWSPVVAAEAAVARTDVALFDMTSLRRLEVAGPGSADFLASVVTGPVGGAVGAVTYCLLLEPDGGIRSDVTVARLAEQRYQLGVNGAVDEVWLTRRLRASPWRDTVQIRDLTPGTCCIGIWGPAARDVLQPLTGTDLSHTAFRYFRGRELYLGAVPVTALRLSYVGELGWELYTTADQGLALWDLLMAAGRDHGIIAAGRGAFTALRIEKGYRSYGTDMTTEHGPADVGLGFAVRSTADFHGRAGLEQRAPGSRRLALLVVDEPDGIVLGGEPVHRPGPDGTAGGRADARDTGEAAVGYVTSAAYGYTLGAPLAYALLDADLAEPGTAVEIGWFDRRYRAVVTAEPAFDPEGKRMRC
ncbi:GcvT family protein [Nakamurella endophytica]|uniref:Sarcosine dehydrogenase n=1 Tax=Nakamurella endophytica TaxID=1748367 RepID=A0A917SPX2_9ACTN|nr:FAD-dependent oxidoreductase [Nakamurella endophytica]GGL89279.1 sarcosine dehydrogenase [Nakamurella endophytica]